MKMTLKEMYGLNDPNQAYIDQLGKKLGMAPSNDPNATQVTKVGKPTENKPKNTQEARERLDVTFRELFSIYNSLLGTPVQADMKSALDALVKVLRDLK